MENNEPNDLEKGENSIYQIVLIAIIFVTVFCLGGCGTKRKVAIDEVSLDPAQQNISDWRTLIQKNKNSLESEKLEVVNVFFNRFDFVDDWILWGRNDYWSTPIEMLTKGGGDCEDFAIAKYFTLRELDVADEKMRITYVIAENVKQPHMVLSYYPHPSADPLILDSLVMAIYTGSTRVDLVPVYAFNANGLWLTQKQRSKRLRGAEGLSLWQDLQRRFNQEAIAAPLDR